MRAPIQRSNNQYIMVAPNGGRKTKKDHPAVPLTVPELLETAKQCADAGAQAIHAHVRDDARKHVLDAGQYRELIAEMNRVLPQLDVQVTTETFGQYSALDQRELVRALEPKHVSIALREQNPESDEAEARRFYHWAEDADIDVQHILYTPADLARLEQLQARSVIPDTPQRVLFVLGRYDDGLPSLPANLDLFLAASNRQLRWMACAFGQAETECLVRAHKLGGEMRVGFENNEINADGSCASNNAERVRDLLNGLSRD